MYVCIYVFIYKINVFEDYDALPNLTLTQVLLRLLSNKANSNVYGNINSWQNVSSLHYVVCVHSKNLAST